MASQLIIPLKSFSAGFPSVAHKGGLASMGSVTWATGQHFLPHPQPTNTPAPNGFDYPSRIYLEAEEDVGVAKKELPS